MLFYRKMYPDFLVGVPYLILPCLGSGECPECRSGLEVAVVKGTGMSGNANAVSSNRKDFMVRVRSGDVQVLGHCHCICIEEYLIFSWQELLQGSE